MTLAKSPRTEKIEEYIAKFPARGNLTLAKVLFKDFPELFSSVENARDSVRLIRGAHGNQHRKDRKIKENLTPPAFVIPDDDNVEYIDFEINPDYTSGIIFSDIHFPYHDKRALQIAIDYALSIQPDFLLLDGDIIDFHQLSFFEKDPTRKNIKEELQMVKEFLRNLKKHLPKTELIFKIGNHEERYDRYLMQHAPALFHLEEVRLKGILDLENIGIQHVGDKRVIRYRGLNIIHGHEYRFSISNPVNPARGIFLRTHKSTLAAHFHQRSEHSETSIDGDTISDWSIGCLCGLHPQWLPLNKWAHGFAEITGLPDGLWRVKNYRILDGVII
jgi:predicted phosphodiesterase